MEVTATLTNVELQRVSDSKSSSGFSLIAWGNIHHDTKGRFAEGFRIHTSRILKIENQFIHTQNSIYEIK